MVIELAVTYLAAWAFRKAKSVGKRVDTEVDRVLDGALDRLHDTVSRWLGQDAAIEKLEDEAKRESVTERTKQRVQLSIEEALEGNPELVDELSSLIQEIQKVERSTGSSVVASGSGAAVVGNVSISADNNSVAAQTLTGGVSIGTKDPTLPGQEK